MMPIRRNNTLQDENFEEYFLIRPFYPKKLVAIAKPDLCRDPFSLLCFLRVSRLFRDFFAYIRTNNFIFFTNFY